jgi:hypothetical protein
MASFSSKFNHGGARLCRAAIKDEVRRMNDEVKKQPETNSEFCIQPSAFRLAPPGGARLRRAVTSP